MIIKTVVVYTLFVYFPFAGACFQNSEAFASLAKRSSHDIFSERICERDCLISVVGCFRWSCLHKNGHMFFLYY